MNKPIQCTKEDLEELKRLALAVRAVSDDDDALGIALDEYDEHANPDQVLCLFEAIDRVTAERDALQQRLTAADERIGKLVRGLVSIGNDLQGQYPAARIAELLKP